MLYSYSRSTQCYVWLYILYILPYLLHLANHYVGRQMPPRLHLNLCSGPLHQSQERKRCYSKWTSAFWGLLQGWWPLHCHLLRQWHLALQRTRNHCEPRIVTLFARICLIELLALYWWMLTILGSKLRLTLKMALSRSSLSGKFFLGNSLVVWSSSFQSRVCPGICSS